MSDIELTFSENAVIQTVEIALERYVSEKPNNLHALAVSVVESAKEMVRRGNYRDGMIIGDNERAALDAADKKENQQ